MNILPTPSRSNYDFRELFDLKNILQEEPHSLKLVQSNYNLDEYLLLLTEGNGALSPSIADNTEQINKVKNTNSN
jgi:hypothetical protein